MEVAFLLVRVNPSLMTAPMYVCPRQEPRSSAWKVLNIMPRIDLCLLRQWSGDRWHLNLRFSTSSLIFLITTSSRWNHRSLIENQGMDHIWDLRFSIWFFDCEFFYRIFEGFAILLLNAQTPQNGQSNLQKCYKFSSRWWKGVAYLFEGALAWNIYDVKQVFLREITNCLRIYSIIALPHKVFLELL